MKTELSYRQNQLPDVAVKLFKAAAGQKIWLISGEPGAGKTTLVKTLVETLGGKGDNVNSPTFSILNQYHTRQGEVYHFDLYRVKTESELFDLGMDEYLDSGCWCFIEWPEKLNDLMPAESFRLEILHPAPADGEQLRLIRFSD